MEHKLGETFTWHGQTLAVAEVKDQEEPFFLIPYYKIRIIT